MRGERKRRRERERKREKRKTHFISFQSSGSFHILTVLSSDDEANKLSSSLNSAQNITPYKKNPPSKCSSTHTDHTSWPFSLTETSQGGGGGEGRGERSVPTSGNLYPHNNISLKTVPEATNNQPDTNTNLQE